MLKPISRNLATSLLTIPLLFIISSCGSDPNLLKVREFAQSASGAKDKFPLIANDIYLSCLREARYRTVSILPPDPLSPAEEKESIEKKKIDGKKVIELKKKIAELKKKIAEFPTPNLKDIEELKRLKLVLRRSGEDKEKIDIQSRIEAQKKCDEESSTLGNKMISGNAVIILYTQKLGSIASEKLINFDSQFDELKAKSGDLKAELEAIFGKKDVNVGAGIDLANFILTSIFDGRRRETLSEVIPSANLPLKNYANGLQKVIKRVYIDQSLRSEERSLDNYYIDYILDILDNKARNEGNSVISIANTLIALDKDWNPKKDEIQQRRAMANSYISLLQTIIDGHEELSVIYGKGEQPSKQAVENLLDKTTVSLKEYLKLSDKISKMSQQ